MVKAKGGLKRPRPSTFAAGTAARVIQGAWRMWKGRKSLQGPRLAQRLLQKNATMSTIRTMVEEGPQEFGVAGPGSETHTIYPKRPYPVPKLTDKAISKQQYTNNNSGNVTWGIGEQNYQLVAAVLDRPQMNTLFPYVGTYATRIHLRNVKWEVMLSNPTTALQRVDVYDIICKKDVQAQGAAAGVGNPQECMQNTFSDFAKNGGGQSSTAYKQLGLTPFTNPAFGQFFRILKVTPLLLQGGQVHSHKCEYTVNKLMDKEYAQYEGKAYKDVTCYTLIRVHGTPENDNTTLTQVSTGAGRINYVYYETLDYAVYDRTTPEIDYTQNLPTAFTAGALIENIGISTQTAPLL